MANLSIPRDKVSKQTCVRAQGATFHRIDSYSLSRIKSGGKWIHCFAENSTMVYFQIPEVLRVAGRVMGDFCGAALWI